MIEGFEAEHLLADKAYDTNEILSYAADNDINVVIPPKRNRIEQREYDKHIYKHRHLVENAFMGTSTNLSFAFESIARP